MKTMRETASRATRRAFLRALPVPALVVTMGLASAQTASPQPGTARSSAYDGSWWISLTCDDVKESQGRVVKGYNFAIAGTIKDGRLAAQYGDEGMRSSLRLSGEVGDGGALVIHAAGLTGSPDYVIGQLRPGSRYGYTMTGHLDERQGEAVRRETRPCKAVFTKQ